MTNPNRSLAYVPIALTLFILAFSCKSKSGKEADKPKKDTLIVPVKRTEKEAQKERPPIINIVDTLTPRRIVI